MDKCFRAYESHYIWYINIIFLILLRVLIFSGIDNFIESDFLIHADVYAKKNLTFFYLLSYLLEIPLIVYIIGTISCLLTVLVEAKDTDYIHNLTLYRAVDSGDLETTKSFLDLHPDALTASLSADGDTALHIAVLAGRVKVVGELVKRIDEKDLAIKNKNGATALNFAATGGVTKIAEYLVRKNRELLTIPNQHGNIPVVIASLYGHDDMVRYLYRETPIEELDPDKGTNGAMLLTSCIIDDIFGEKIFCCVIVLGQWLL